ncbi:MAG: GNAT family N-acetyltransferase [Cyanobacteria bacterium J06631_2]
MLKDKPEEAEYYLWRFMIDARYQGLGFDRRALLILIDRVKTRPNATQLLTSVVPGSGSPQGFYKKLGFKLTSDPASA